LQQRGTSLTTVEISFFAQQGLSQSGGHLGASSLASQHFLSQSGGHFFESSFFAQHCLAQFKGQALTSSDAPIEALVSAGAIREPVSRAPASRKAVIATAIRVFLRFINILLVIHYVLALIFLSFITLLLIVF
jgi:hypothetical protein